jgi:multidrug resistance efflux pump
MPIVHQAPNVGAAHEAEPPDETPRGLPADGPPAIRDMHKALGDAFGLQQAETPAAADDAAPQDAPKDSPKSSGIWAFALNRPLRIGAALALILAFGAWPLQTLLQAASVEAVVNSRIVTIRAPIDGEIIAAPTDFSAWTAVKGSPALRIVDTNANRARFDDSRQTLGRLEDDRLALMDRIGQTQARLAALDGQTRQFQSGRIKQLEARIGALESDLTGATARAEEARLAEQRTASLLQSGIVSVAEGARINRNKLVADAAEIGARQRVEEATVELKAAREGSFLGDSYNDRPSSAQRADDARLRVDDLTAELRKLDAQIERARANMTDQENQFQGVSDVEVALPASGRVWEIMTAPGEHVRRGQDLIRLLDCSTAVVTATVAETVYNKLRIGGAARFRPADERRDYDGIIVNLTGLSAAPANFAIQPKVLAADAYHVTVALPKLATHGECAIGRTGRVVFDKSAPEVAAESLAFGLRR